MNITKTKEAVAKLFDATEIVAIYYIDDKFQEAAKIEDHFEEFEIAIEKRCESGDTKGFPKNVIEADPVNRGMEIKKWWESGTTEERNQLFNRYADSESKNGYPAMLIKDLLGKDCICCSPSHWNTHHKNTALSYIKKKKQILLLFDQELSNSIKGLDYAVSFFDNPKVAKFTYCGIISNQFRIESEFAEREEYKKQQPNYYIYPLSKERLTVQQDDYEPFLSGLKNVLWVKHIEILKTQTRKVLKSAFKNTINRYFEIQPPAYKKIIVDSSQKEGCRELDTMLRLLHIILDKEIKESLVSKNFLKLVNSESNIIATIDSDMSRQYPETDEQAKVFIKDEKFIEGKTLNALYTPLQNGDIFNINNERWILLCQPCNIAIRKNGRRGNDYNTGFLIRLTPSKDVQPMPSEKKLLETICKNVKNMLSEEEKKFRSNELNDYKKAIQQLITAENQLNFALDFEIGQVQYTVQFNLFRTIDLELLDNVSFNADGNAVINLKQVDIPQMHKNLVDRKTCINQRFEKLSTSTQHFKTHCNHCEHYEMLVDLFASISKDINFDHIESDKITFPIQRIGHYRSPFADVLLTKFTHYLSRAGFPHPFVER